MIREQGLVCRAPALSKGDVLFWAAKTIHGSLRTTQPTRSRRSFTAHFIPDAEPLFAISDPRQAAQDRARQRHESAPPEGPLEGCQPCGLFRRDSLPADFPDDEKSGHQACHAVTVSWLRVVRDYSLMIKS